MSFFTPTIPLDEQPIIPFVIANNVLFDYELVEYINLQLLDSISPNLIYDMNRYINENAIQMQPFYKSNFNTFNDFIYNIIINIDTSMTPEENHLMIFFSTTKKMYIYNMSNSQLSLVDNYILSWMKMNYSVSEIADYRNLVLNNPDAVRCFDI